MDLISGSMMSLTRKGYFSQSSTGSVKRRVTSSKASPLSPPGMMSNDLKRRASLHLQINTEEELKRASLHMQMNEEAEKQRSSLHMQIAAEEEAWRRASVHMLMNQEELEEAAHRASLHMQISKEEALAEIQRRASLHMQVNPDQKPVYLPVELTVNTGLNNKASDGDSQTAELIIKPDLASEKPEASEGFLFTIPEEQAEEIRQRQV